MQRSFFKDFTIDNYPKLASTNDLTLELSLNNQIGNFHVIKADEQENGHGRYLRNWHSPKGNLYFSFLLIPKNQNLDYSLLSFVSAVSLSKTILEISDAKNLDIKHKWPNDILINNKKVAGILLKNQKQNNINKIIIGIGVNVDSFPKENVNFKATSLKEVLGDNLKVNLDEFLQIFLTNFEIFYQKFLTFGFSSIRNIWLDKAFGLGEEINVKLSDTKKVTALFKDLNNSGNLILEDKNKEIQIISSAEIF